MDEVTKVEIKNIKENISEIKEDSKKHDGAINEIVNKLAVLTANLELNTTSTEKLAKAVEDIKNKPLQILEKVKIAVITAICTSVAVTLIVTLLKNSYKN
ncbi:hypothetical protein [Clostridium sp. HBUAS56017]|jgi:chromosome segregation ATPase|uniref:hypothetical protein n=1 Tax=Clostridium sp. HBUAS56017 TaxID=2571128 RepID=UPI001178BF98|nr:hypothetical protein [Clostridium sp. HBUAS56017]